MSDAQTFVAIRSDDLSASINPFGAELSTLRDAQGRDLLWDGDPAMWSGRAPILFPIVGALAGGRFSLNGKTYALEKHGFARRSQFVVVSATAQSATFRLGWDQATHEVYPFRFELDVGFELQGATLTIEAVVRNVGSDGDMPASFGFHPALRWPLPYGQRRAEHLITFADDESAPIRRINSAGLVTPTSHTTPVTGRDLELRDDLFADDAIIFDQLTSRGLRYGAKTGPYLDIRFPDAELLGVWTKPGAGYVCIEPWWGWSDPEGFEGDIWAKPGIFTVPAGASRRLGMSVTLCS